MSGGGNGGPASTGGLGSWRREISAFLEQLAAQNAYFADDTAERRLLGGLIQTESAEQVLRVLTGLPKDVWTTESRDRLARQMWRCAQHQGVVDVSVLLTEGAEHDRNEVLQCIAAGRGLNGTQLRALTATVKGHAHRRRFIAEAATGLSEAVAGQPMMRVEMRRFSAHRRALRYLPTGSVTPTEQVEQFVEWTHAVREGTARVFSGLPRLDKHGGWFPGLYLLVGRTSNGKTALALSLAVNQALAGKRVVYWSGEQSLPVIMAKTICVLTGASFETVIDYERQADPIRNAVVDSMSWIKNGPFRLLVGAKSMFDLERELLDLADQQPVEVIYLDQLSKIELPPGRITGNTNEEKLAHVSTQLAKWSGQDGFHCPLVLLHQLSFKGEGPAPVKPHLGLIRRCAQLVEDADVALLVDSPMRYRERFEAFMDKKAKAQDAGDYQTASELAVDDGIIVMCGKDRNHFFDNDHWEELVRFNRHCGRFEAGDPNPNSNPITKSEDF